MSASKCNSIVENLHTDVEVKRLLKILFYIEHIWENSSPLLNMSILLVPLLHVVVRVLCGRGDDDELCRAGVRHFLYGRKKRTSNQRAMHPFLQAVPSAMYQTRLLGGKEVRRTGQILVVSGQVYGWRR